MKSTKGGQVINKLISAVSAIIIAGGVLVGNTVVAKAASEAEPNDEFKTAVAIETNKDYVGVISTTDDKDFYKFTTSEAGIISFDFSNEQSKNDSWEVILGGTECNELYKTHVSGKNKTIVSSPKYGVKPGTYYIEVSGYWMTGTNYTVKANFTATNDWEKELNEKPETANEIALGQTVNGNIYKETDEDWYKFTIPEAGIISFDFENDYSDNDSWVVTLRGTECGDIYSTNISGKNKTTVSSPQYGVKAGTYYIKVSGYWMKNINYSIKANFTPTTDWEQENNDSMDKATIISSGKEVSGNIYHSTDVDYYRYDVSRAGKISVDFSNEYHEDDSWYIEFIDPSGKTIYDKNISGKNLETIKSEEFDAKVGTYYIKVSGYWMVNKTYRIKVNNTATYRDCVWEVVDGKSYWYENDIRQGTYDDPQGVLGDGTVRGREIYDPASNAWYWLDSIYDGAKACGKEVWMPYVYQDEDTWDDEKKRNIAYESDEGMGEFVLNAIRNKTGKWVRYDSEGKMLKGWVTIEGDLAALYPDQAGNTYYYDTRTGLMAKGHVTIGGVEYYFDEITGVRQ